MFIKHPRLGREGKDLLLMEMRRYPKAAERIRLFINGRVQREVFSSTCNRIYTCKFNMVVASVDLFQCDSCNRSVLRWKCIHIL